MSKLLHFRAQAGLLVVEGEKVRARIVTDQTNFQQVQIQKLAHLKGRLITVRSKAIAAGATDAQLAELDGEVLAVDGVIAGL